MLQSRLYQQDLNHTYTHIHNHIHTTIYICSFIAGNYD
jgi:hypothetical protein